MNYKDVEERLVCKVINRDKNERLLHMVPHMDFLDLAVIAVVRIHDEELGDGVMTISHWQIRDWQITEEELLFRAKQNTLRLMTPEFISIHTALQGMVLISQDDQQIPMYVLTNSENWFGASGLLYDVILRDIGKTLEDDYWILPSSVHECIIVPGSVDIPGEEFSRMVRQVNETEVAEQDFLSDSVYYYTRRDHRLRIAM